MEKVRDLIKPVYKQFVQELTSAGTKTGVFVVEYKDLRFVKCMLLIIIYKFFHMPAFFHSYSIIVYQIFI